VVSSTAAATLRQLVVFVIDKVVEEDQRMLLANELESITLPDGTTQALGPAARDTFSIFEDLCLFGKGERSQILQLEYLHKTFALKLIESALINYHQLFRKVCLSSSLPIRGLYTGSCLQITIKFTTSRALTIITTPPLPLPPQNVPQALRFPASIRSTVLFSSRSSTVILLRARDGGPHYSSNSLLARLTPVSPGLGG